MTRGYLGSLASSPASSGAEKDWHITLQQSSCYWYDLIVNPPNFGDTKEGISSYLKKLREMVEKTLEKRFIYFFASRTKVRFDVTRPPRYSLFKKQLLITLLIGQKRKRQKIKVRFGDQNGKPLTPRVEISDRFISIYYNDTTAQTFPVHDFLQTLDISLGIPTEVHYVGITKDPSNRPLSRKHRGIADTLYNVSNEENDFFIFINLFKVTSIASNYSYGLHFAVANSMIDEISTEEEGKIVENAIIAYFDCASQYLNREKERSELNNKLTSLAEKNKINSVSVHLEMEQPNEYFIFGSVAIPAAISHSFLFRHKSEHIDVERFTSEAELKARLDEVNNVQ